MPATLLEPLFVSNPRHVVWITGEDGQDRTGPGYSVRASNASFEQGGLIGFSVGHKYKSANPGDRGAPVLGGGWEADYAEAVLEKAKVLLEGKSPPSQWKGGMSK